MFYRVNNSEIEGQHPLVRVTPVVLLKSRVVLAVPTSILSQVYPLDLHCHDLRSPPQVEPQALQQVSLRTRRN